MNLKPYSLTQSIDALIEQFNRRSKPHPDSTDLSVEDCPNEEGQISIVSSARLIRVEGEGSGPPSFLHGSPSDSCLGSTLVHSMHLGGTSGEFLSAKDLIGSRGD